MMTEMLSIIILMKEILSIMVLFSGWFYDQTGSYVVSFLIVAGIEFAAAIITGVEIALFSDNNRT